MQQSKLFTDIANGHSIFMQRQDKIYILVHVVVFIRFLAWTDLMEQISSNQISKPIDYKKDTTYLFISYQNKASDF